MSFLAYNKEHALASVVTTAKDPMRHNRGNPTMINDSNPLLSKAQ
jgi:hypothetical protein